jgi:hypothetical protein
MDRWWQANIFPAVCRSAFVSFVVLSGERQERPMIEFKPRFFVLPAIALTVLAMLHPADGGNNGACGVRPIADPGIRESFLNFERGQSATAAKICAVANNNSR